MRHKKIINMLILLLTAALLFSCEESTGPDNGDEQKPPGYQEDIPWPSLADSPWPMSNGNPQNTGRSREELNLSGIIEDEINAQYMQSGISVHNDSLFLFITDSLYAVNIIGKIKEFSYSIGDPSLVTPLIDSEGNIYTASSIKPKIYSLDQQGDLRYNYTTEGGINGPMLNIDKNGRLFFLDDQKYLYSLDTSGDLLWRQKLSNASNYSFGMSFSPEGHILYIPGKNKTLIAFDIRTQSIIWEYGDIPLRNAPVVDSYGNIYILPKYEAQGKANLITLNPDGDIKWKYSFYNNGESLFNSNTPTIDKNGNIYFATDSLYSLNFNGELNWKQPLKGFSDSHLICDYNSNIYVGTMGVENNTKIAISCFDKTGELQWELLFNQIQIGGSPAIAYGKLFYPSWRGSKLFVIK